MGAPACRRVLLPPAPGIRLTRGYNGKAVEQYRLGRSQGGLRIARCFGPSIEARPSCCLSFAYRMRDALASRRLSFSLAGTRLRSNVIPEPTLADSRAGEGMVGGIRHRAAQASLLPGGTGSKDAHEDDTAARAATATGRGTRFNLGKCGLPSARRRRRSREATRVHKCHCICMPRLSARRPQLCSASICPSTVLQPGVVGRPASSMRSTWLGLCATSETTSCEGGLKLMLRGRSNSN